MLKDLTKALKMAEDASLGLTNIMVDMDKIFAMFPFKKGKEREDLLQRYIMLEQSKNDWEEVIDDVSAYFNEINNSLSKLKGGWFDKKYHKNRIKEMKKMITNEFGFEEAEEPTHSEIELENIKEEIQKDKSNVKIK